MRVLPKSTPNQVNLDFGITCACSPISQYIRSIEISNSVLLASSFAHPGNKKWKKKCMLHMAQAAQAALFLFLFFFFLQPCDRVFSSNE